MHAELISAIRRATKAMQRASLATKFDSNQPRIPPGNEDGGQWTDGGGGSASTPRSRPRPTAAASSGAPASSWKLQTREKIVGGERTLHVGPNGARIASERRVGIHTGTSTSRHSVLLPDGSGLKVENDRFGVQRIFDRSGNLLSTARWGRNGPEEIGTAQPAYFDDRPKRYVTIPIPQTIAALELYRWYLSSQVSGGLPVLGFRAAKFTGKERGLAPTYVGAVAEEDVDFACPRHQEVRGLTTAFANELRPLGMSPQVFGTAVHTRLKDEIQERNDPALKTEHSYWKAEQELGKEKLPRYGLTGTLRVDVLEEVSKNTVCVYDIKTGKSSFSLARMKEIVGSVHRHFPNSTDFFLIEVRPD